MNANYPAFADPAWYQQQAAAQQAAAQQAAAVAQNVASAAFTPHFTLAGLDRLGIGPLPQLQPIPPGVSLSNAFVPIGSPPGAALPPPTGQAFGPITNLPAQTAPLPTGTLNPDTHPAAGSPAASAGLTSMQTALIVGIAGFSAYELYKWWTG